MKAVQIVKPNELRIIDMPKPEINEHDNVLVKIKASGICGSDVGIYHGTNAAATYPRVIGHEIVGEIVEVGPNVKTRKVGERVIIDQVTACGHCYACRKSRPNVCQNLQVRGVHIDGGYREFMAVPEKDCYVIPDFLEYRDAVMIEPTTIAVQACSRAQLESEDDVLIIGAGALGSSLLRIVKLFNPHSIIMADIDEARLDEALSKGATAKINSRSEDLVKRAKELTGGYGPTVTIDAACVKGSLLNACQAAGNATRVITMGFSIAPDEINQFVITSKELDIRGSRLQNRKFGEVIKLVNEHKVDLNGAVSHTFPFMEAQKAFDFVDSRDPSIRKISLIFD
ncbi:MAG: alcohol dehydrogenase catalytic domain-containing protein [Synergistaceae bacterium]|nr:alcohol dehydrogenase catalytic domain-containing protein [Synergistaceae bacterium]